MQRISQKMSFIKTFLKFSRQPKKLIKKIKNKGLCFEVVYNM